MKLKLTNDEYRCLLDMIYIAEWVMNAHKTEEECPTDEYAMLVQKVYSLADQAGCRGLVEYDEALKKYFPTRRLEDGPASSFIDAYDNDTFWDGLLERLVLRDMVRLIGAERLERMDLGEILEAEKPLRDKYATEFEEKGIERLEVMPFLPC